MLICTVSDCQRPQKYQCGYCKMHYQRLNRYGRVHNTNREKGEGSFNRQGYKLVYINGERLYEHTHIAEKALGKPLPKGAIVHHFNGKPWDNRPSNLVVCPSQGYHLLLHRREAQFKK